MDSDESEKWGNSEKRGIGGETGQFSSGSNITVTEKWKKSPKTFLLDFQLLGEDPPILENCGAAICPKRVCYFQVARETNREREYGELAGIIPGF